MNPKALLSALSAKAPNHCTTKSGRKPRVRSSEGGAAEVGAASMGSSLGRFLRGGKDSLF